MLMKRCAKCGAYTLKDSCSCGEKAQSAHPFKFSMEKEKKYGKYRNQANSQ